MKDRPILFSAPMVRAILAGTKTQTRRIVKPQPHKDAVATRAMCDSLGGPRTTWSFNDANGIPVPWKEAVAAGTPPFRHAGRCPYGASGDRLWVRETWCEVLHTSPSTDQPELSDGDKLIEPATSWVDEKGRTRWNYDGRVIAYRATSNTELCDGDGFVGENANREDMPRWKPSIHMPRWASRITLEITGVHVERLQGISEEDAIAEGMNREPPDRISSTVYSCPGTGHVSTSAYGLYRGLWKSINGRGSWEANPWVWCLSFRVVKS